VNANGTVGALSTPLTPRSETVEAPRNRARLALFTRAALVIGACLCAYHYSLLTLIQGLTVPTPLAFLGGVPLISLLLFAARLVQRNDELDIHDRYLDWIIAILFLAAALTLVWIVPMRLSTYFWVWRLDLLSLPLFVAGAIGLVFGARALWRLRIPVVFLGLAWPIPYMQLASSPLAGAGHMIARYLTAILPVAPPLDSTFLGSGAALSLLLIGGLVIGPIAHRPASPRTCRRRSPRALAVPRARIALGVILAAGALAGMANESLPWFEQLATPLGQPRLQAYAVANHPVPGWIVLKTNSYTWVTDLGEMNGAWDRYLYASGTGEPMRARPAITLDLFTDTDRAALTASPIERSYRLHGYRLVETRPSDLGGEVVGQSIIYRSNTSSETWTAVYWEWPVKTAAGPGYERVVLSVRGPLAVVPQVATAAGGVMDRLRTAVGDVFGHSSGGPATASEEALRAFLIEFGRQVVLANVGRPA
jgi:hypothetical protein